MGKNISMVILFLAAFTTTTLTAQTSTTKPAPLEDTTIGIKPSIKIENISPEGHCNNQQLSFYAPWADYYEVAKKRIDTGWINNFKPVNSWSYQALKPGVNALIYKNLDEKGDFQFTVKAIKASRYLKSDTITIKSCLSKDPDK